MPLVPLKKQTPQQWGWGIPFYCLLFFLAVILSQTQIDKSRAGYSKIEEMKYLPSGQFLKGAALAYDELFADFLWIKAVGYFGNRYQSDQNYKWLYHLLDVIVTLDPYFEFPYEFGGVALAYWTKDISHSIKILKKGMANIPKTHPRYWTIPFYLGFNYMYYKKDFGAAAGYLEEATKYPGSPRFLPALVSRLYANAGDPEIAIRFLMEIYRTSNNEKVREDLKRRIKEIIVERDIQLLERARDQYEKKTGSYPLDIEDLLSAGFLKEIPGEPFGGKYFIEKDHSIHSSLIKKRMKVFIN